MSETKITCPKCGSTCCIVTGNEKHCNQCGKSWDLDRSPISTVAAKRKAERSAATGWPPRPE